MPTYRFAPTRAVRRCVRFAALMALCAPLMPLSAQDKAATPAGPGKEEEPIVELPAFNVIENSANPYQANQAVSSSRVAMSIQNIPQTVSVVTSQLLEDTLGQRLLDTAKYVTPVVESTLPFGADRYMIRGFQVSHEFIDGVEISGADGYSMSMAQYNIDRVEIIKGPNAILVPGGSPGGQMNPITKSPLNKDKSSVTLELAQYMGNAVSADLNKVVNPKNASAVRMVAAYWRNDGYLKNQYRNGYLFAPSYAINLNDNNRLVLKAEILQNRETNLAGVPLDPLVGSFDYARPARGLPRDWTFGNDGDSRHRATERATAELFSTLSDHITSRLQVIADHVRRIDSGGTGAALKGISAPRNPATGYYIPDATKIPDPSTWVYSRNNGKVDLEYKEAHLKNDYAAKFETSWVNSTTVAGFGANYSEVHFISYPASARPDVPNNNLGSITYPAYTWNTPTTANGGTDRTGEQKDLQLFLYENLSFLKDRLSVSGGISRFKGSLDRTDHSGVGLNPYPEYDLDDTAESFGVVVKPIKEVSLFYGYNSSGGTMPGSLNAGNYAPSLKVAAGTQNEYGVKTSFLDGSLTASVAYFDIQQQNYAVPNSEYYTLISQGITPPPDFPNTLFLDLNSKGWEFEGSYAFSRNLTLLGNYTRFEIRQPITNVRVRGVPDEAAGLYADYRFTDGVLDGFGLNVGVDYKSDVVGENATGYTQTSKPPFVPNQPTFLVAGRTVVNIGVSYRTKDWTARLTLANALDKDYVQAAGSRTSIIMAEPRALRGSVTYSF